MRKLLSYFSRAAVAQRAMDRHRKAMSEELDLIFRRRRELDAREAELVHKSAALAMQELSIGISARVARGYA